MTEVPTWWMIAGAFVGLGLSRVIAWIRFFRRRRKFAPSCNLSERGTRPGSPTPYGGPGILGKGKPK